MPRVYPLRSFALACPTVHRVTAPVLGVRGISQRFGTKEVLRDVSLSVSAGQRVALRGPNGSGKSTLLRCVLGTQLPVAGEVLIAGRPAGTVAARRQIGATLSQERSFYLRLSAGDNLRFFASLRHRDRRLAKADVAAIADELELASFLAQRVDRCSTGMIQQLGFARALLGAPALLLLDEPTRSLDDAAVARLWAALERRAETAVVIATHRADDIARCDGEFVLAR